MSWAMSRVAQPLAIAYCQTPDAVVSSRCALSTASRSCTRSHAFSNSGGSTSPTRAAQERDTGLSPGFGLRGRSVSLIILAACLPDKRGTWLRRC